MAVFFEPLTKYQSQLLSEPLPVVHALKGVAASGFLADGKSALEIRSYLNTGNTVSLNLRQITTYLNRLVKANLICRITNTETDRFTYFNRLDVSPSTFL